MKILLVEPAKPPLAIGGDDAFIFEPLALEYLAAGISKDHEVKILDLRLEAGLKPTIREFQPDIVGITAYTIHVNSVRELFKDIKTWQPEILTVVGGHHATVLPKDFNIPEIDLIVVGEGVVPFREIVCRYEDGEQFTGIPGVIQTAGSDFEIPYDRSDFDLDSLPHPDRKVTGRYRQAYYSDWMKPLASIRTSKGCPYRCKFCALWKLTGGRYLKRKPEAIVEELTGIDEECIFFADDESLLDSPRMARLATLIEDAGIRKRYYLYARSDTVTRNPVLLESWRDIGLERVFVGVESFRKQDLEYIRKKSSTSDNTQAIKIINDLGIQVNASFIIRPEFTKSDFQSLRNYCRELGLNNALFAVLTPLPGTDLYEEVEDQLITRNYDYYDFIHTVLPTTLPLKDFYSEYHDLFVKGFTFRDHVSYMKNYPLKDIPGILPKAWKFYQRLKSAYRDYEI